MSWLGKESCFTMVFCYFLEMDGVGAGAGAGAVLYCTVPFF